MIEAAGGDLPTNFLLAWASRESGGNPCDYTSMGEAGIFQLQPGDNMRNGGTSTEALRSACGAGGSRYAARALTSDELAEQVRSGIQYVNWCRAQARKALDAVGADWPETSSDFWKMVKLVHTLPSLMGGLSAAATDLGRPPATWDEFRPYAAAMYGGPKWLPNAEYVGQFGEGGGSALGGKGWLAVVFLGALGLGAWLTAGRRVPQ